MSTTRPVTRIRACAVRKTARVSTPVAFSAVPATAFSAPSSAATIREVWSTGTRAA